MKGICLKYCWCCVVSVRKKTDLNFEPCLQISQDECCSFLLQANLYIVDTDNKKQSLIRNKCN